MVQNEPTVTRKEFDQLKQLVTQHLQDGTKDASAWCSFATFTQRNNMGRTRLNSLISKGLIEVNKDAGPQRFLYRWK